MKQFAATAALLALCGLPQVQAQEIYMYDHNGSVMLVGEFGEDILIQYEDPRPGLEKQGVRTGTTLFEGKINSIDYLDGMARIFRGGCAPIDYYVYGDFVLGEDFELSGAAPVLEPTGCRIIDNTYEGANANLKFTVLGVYAASTVDEQEDVAYRDDFFCVTGVNSTLNVRTGPGSDYGVIAELPADQCDINSSGNEQSGYVVITAPDGTYGWVARKYLAAQR